MKGGEKMIRGLKTPAAIAAAIVFFAAGYADAMSLKITTPAQSPIAPSRDFYVTGTIDRSGAPASFDVRVDIYDTSGKKIRTTMSTGITDSGITGTDAISMDYPNKGYWFDQQAGSRDMLAQNPPPDLVFVPGKPGSFYSPAHKVAVTKGTFAALIFGGCTKGFDVDYSELSDIGEGKYRIVASAAAGGIDIASADLELEVSVVPDKMLTRFSPASHTAIYTPFADAHGYRLYLDYFPGYWPLTSDVKYEIPARWRANDSYEYSGGNVHAILYNVDNKRCASQKVELGYLVKRGDIESARMHFYTYDTGEPYVYSGGKLIEGKITEFDKAEKFKVLRAEFRDKTAVTSDNVYLVYEKEKSADIVSTSEITVYPGKILSLFGAAVPVPADVTEGTVLSNDAGTYNVDNFIDTIHYELLDGADVILSCDKKIGLERWMEPESDSYQWPEYASVYEYKHDFLIPDTPGRTLTLRMTAYTTKNKTIPAARKTLLLNVSDGKSSGSSGGCSAAGLPAAILIFVIPAAAALAAKQK